jgi:hypothetical protein
VDTAILPLAITMMAGPQILSAIVFVTSDDPIRVSLAYDIAIALTTAGWVLFWTLIAGDLGNDVELSDGSEPSTAGKVIPVALVALLILASLKAYIGRETAEPPKWLGRLQGAGPGRAFVLGVLLISLMPSDIVILMTTGVSLESEGNSFSAALPFIGLTTAIAALPLAFYVLFRQRAQVTMPKVRDWMNANSWLVNICVYAIFIALILA